MYPSSHDTVPLSTTLLYVVTHAPLIRIFSTSDNPFYVNFAHTPPLRHSWRKSVSFPIL